MKVLVVVHDYLPAHVGGSELVAHRGALAMRERGHEVVVAYTERDLARPEGALARGSHEGLPTIELVHQREYEDVGETFREPVGGAGFERILAEESPDLVHFHHLAYWGSACIERARAAGAATVVTLHDYHLVCDASTLLRPSLELCSDGPRGRCGACIARHPLLRERWPEDADASEPELFERIARRRLEQHRAHLRLADCVIAPSAFLRDLFVDAGLVEPERVVVLKAGYPGPTRPPRASVADRPLRVAYVGGIYPSKGVHVLVEAFRHLRGEPVELAVHGVLAWFPDYVAELRALAEGSAVTLCGPFEPERIDEVLATIDVLCVPSLWYENQPLTIQEAFRNGVPVVATDLGGMREAVRDGVDGLFFPRADASALANVLSRLASDRALVARLASGRPHVPAVDEIADRIAELYENAAAAARGRD